MANYLLCWEELAGLPILVVADAPDAPASVAFILQQAGADVVAVSLPTKLQGKLSKVALDTVAVEQHRNLAEPGSANQ